MSGSGVTGTGFDFGSDGNTVDNFVVDLNDPKSRSLNIPIKYSYYGARLVFDGQLRAGKRFPPDHKSHAFRDPLPGSGRAVLQANTEWQYI